MILIWEFNSLDPEVINDFLATDFAKTSRLVTSTKDTKTSKTNVGF